MNKVPKSYKKDALSLVEGSWHQKDHYRYLRRELFALGYYSIHAGAPTDDPESNFDMEAEQLTADEAYAGLEKVHRYAHSSGSNIAVRNADHVEGIILNGSGFHPQTYRPSYALREELADRYTPEFEDGIRGRMNSPLTTFNALSAKIVFYERCSTPVSTWAISRRRPYRRYASEPRLLQLPETRFSYIANLYDNAVKFLYQMNLARLVLGIEPIIVPCGHSPHLENPKLLAEAIDSAVSSNHGKTKRK